MTEQAYTSSSVESTEDKHVRDVSHSVLLHCIKVTTHNDYKPSTRVKLAAFNSSGNFLICLQQEGTVYTIQCLMRSRLWAFFQHKLLQKLTQAYLDAHTECTSLDHFLCCCNLAVSECWLGPCSPSGGGCPRNSLTSFSWAAPLQQDHSDRFILPSCWGPGSKLGGFYAEGLEFLSPEVKVAWITLFPAENRSHCGLHTFLAMDNSPAFPYLERQWVIRTIKEISPSGIKAGGIFLHYLVFTLRPGMWE